MLTYTDQVRNLVDVGIANSTRDIAMESRRDASAMKTIAILTLVFLPGTYVAVCAFCNAASSYIIVLLQAAPLIHPQALFSMSMFNWQARDGEPVISSHIWVYFVIAIPLTILVVAVWLWWFCTQEKAQRHDIELQRLPGSRPVSTVRSTKSGKYNHGSSRP